MIDKTIDERFLIRKKLHENPNFIIYKAVDLKNSSKVALKIDILPSENSLVTHEREILSNLNHQASFPRVYVSGISQGLNYIAQSYLGKSLQHYFEQNGKLSLACILKIGDELLLRIESLHKAGFVHRNLKPENIHVGYGTNWQSLFVIGYRTTTKYLEDNNEDHVHMRRTYALPENATYSSLNTLNKYVHSRRDDIESLIYMLIHFLSGKLPWLANKNASPLEIKTIKESISFGKLCDNCPTEFLAMLRYTRSLKFDEEPNYEMLRNSLSMLAIKNRIAKAYDWSIKQEKINFLYKVKKPKKIFQMSTDMKKYLTCAVPKIGAFSPKQISLNRSLAFPSIGNESDCRSEDTTAELVRTDTVELKTFPEFSNKAEILRLRQEFLNSRKENA
ncbi:hypothetical protein SteCoe_9601 [Stentor coeruleus]|uniref:Casein kinase I n=1 Tax=Stentor coeruleus TaxID=5963 RepID=A0A1R2CHG8_9CILI|nr:hypothetical protein SteCoe_9601 [Stentor coeruleus]